MSCPLRIATQTPPNRAELQKQMLATVRDKAGQFSTYHGRYSRFDCDCDMSRAGTINIAMFMQTSPDATHGFVQIY